MVVSSFHLQVNRYNDGIFLYKKPAVPLLLQAEGNSQRNGSCCTVLYDEILTLERNWNKENPYPNISFSAQLERLNYIQNYCSM